jgi:hypothetical protein
MEGVGGKFYGHLVYFTGIPYNLWPFGIFVGNWYLFTRFGKYCREKSGNLGEKQNLHNVVHLSEPIGRCKKNGLPSKGFSKAG